MTNSMYRISSISPACVKRLIFTPHQADRPATLAGRLEKLLSVERILTAQVNSVALLQRIVPAANRLFNPFGKHLEIAVISYQPEPQETSHVAVIKKNAFYECAGNLPDFLRQQLAERQDYQAIARAVEQKVCCRAAQDKQETVIVPVLRGDKICGIIILTNQSPDLPENLHSGGKFSRDDLAVADQFSYSVSQALAVAENRKTAL